MRDINVVKNFQNCFVDNDNEAIQRGWLTWPIVVAMQFANASQRQVLRDCYGDEDNEANAERYTLISVQWLVQPRYSFRPNFYAASAISAYLLFTRLNKSHGQLQIFHIPL